MKQNFVSETICFVSETKFCFGSNLFCFGFVLETKFCFIKTIRFVSILFWKDLFQAIVIVCCFENKILCRDKMLSKDSHDITKRLPKCRRAASGGANFALLKEMSLPKCRSGTRGS